MTNDVDTRIMIDVENYKNIFVHEFEENKIDDNLFLKTYVTYFYHSEKKDKSFLMHFIYPLGQILINFIKSPCN